MCNPNLFISASDSDADLIELLNHYDDYMRKCALHRNPYNWEDCYSYVKLCFITLIKNCTFQKYLNRSPYDFDLIVRSMLKNKSFDYWRRETRHFNEYSSITSDNKDSLDCSIDSLVDKLYLRNLLSKLTLNEANIINEVILKDRAVSDLSEELQKSKSAINKSKRNALKKLSLWITSSIY